MKPRLHILLLALLLCLPSRADDDRVRLISAKSAQLIEKDGVSYRKVVGPAKFLHNDTYLLCDTALWNVNTNIIDAVGHVKIIQDRTRLSSETLQYVVDDNLARFRGSLVQLEDDEKNTLRTRYLDYNTKDSVAIFQGGAAMRDKDGEIMESQYGTYDSKAHLFVFNQDVNMYMDTTFVKTSRLEYRSDLSTAYFGHGTDMWQDDKMLSADDGWYRRPQELFFFRRRVHLLTETQEAWSDSMFYERSLNNISMQGNVELMDSTRNVYALAGRFDYTDSLSLVEMTREPAVMSITEENRRRDSLYIGADILRYRTIKMCDIPEGTLKAAQKRLSDISGDPVAQYRKKYVTIGKTTSAKKDTSATVSPSDTLPPPPDTTKVTFLYGSRRVKLFRRDMQMCSDSLTYTDLDSLFRLYKDPVFFNEGNKQYASDSMYMVVRNRAIERAHLLSNAFITIQEDTASFDQIRGTEMVAYFDSTRALTRFDALGGAASVFYLVENDALATVNKVESKMLYAIFKDGEMEKIYYFDNPHNDGYPTVQMPEEEKKLKGFRWEPERRPSSPKDITSFEPRPSQRYSYLARPHTSFEQTEIYFPGHVRKVYRDIAIRDSLKVLRARQRGEEIKEIEPALPEVPADTVAKKPVTDTTARKATPADTLAKQAPSDSLSADTPRLPTAKELKKQEREKKKAQKQARLEAKWAEQDRKYEERQAAKAAKKLQKERARKLKALKRLEKKARREQAILNKYIRKYRKK